MAHRRWRLVRPLHLGQTWGPLARGAHDPTWKVDAGALWRGIRTPHGAVTLRVEVIAGVGAHGEVAAHVWGVDLARDWILTHLPAMLGEEDDDSGFEPRHARVAAARRAHPGWRVPRTGLVLESLIPAVLEQKVTGAEALSGYRRLVRRHGDPAPGPGVTLGLRVAPSVAVLRALPSWEWLQLGVGPQRSDTVARLLRSADALQECADLPLAVARRRISAIPGIGVWTTAETCQRALGDADAVSFGDYHIARNLTWALTGVEGDDHALAELIADDAPHRYRVQRLLELDGAFRPRRGPRMGVRAHLPVRPSPRG